MTGVTINEASFAVVAGTPLGADEMTNIMNGSAPSARHVGGRLASVALLILSAAMAFRGAAFLVFRSWLALAESFRLPIDPDRADVMFIWSAALGFSSAPYSLLSVVSAAAAWRLGRFKWFLWVPPVLAVFGTALFWLQMYVGLRD